jgi:hypothetical protein
LRKITGVKFIITPFSTKLQKLDVFIYFRYAVSNREPEKLAKKISLWSRKFSLPKNRFLPILTIQFSDGCPEYIKLAKIRAGPVWQQ